MITITVYYYPRPTHSIRARASHPGTSATPARISFRGKAKTILYE